MDEATLTSLIAAVSAGVGAAAKMAYDSASARIRRRTENSDRFAEERKALYDEFLRVNREHAKHHKRVIEITLIARAGKDVKAGILEEFPESPLGELVELLEKIRAIARTHEIVRVAERIVANHGDAAGAMRVYLRDDATDYGLPLFLAERFGEDLVLEFITAYRRDLELGPPEGAANDFPTIDRGYPYPKAEAEAHLRAHLRAFVHPAAPRFEAPLPGVGKPLTERDQNLLDTPRFRELIRDESIEAPADGLDTAGTQV